jgi:hypothetical protein
MQIHTTPTGDHFAVIPTEHMRNGPHLNRTFTVRRKAAKRTFPWDLPGEEIQIARPRPQDEDDHIRATKRPRLEEPLPTPTDEVTTENTAHDTTVALPAQNTAAAATTESADSDSVTDMHPIPRATGTSHYWTSVEDAQLTRAVTTTPKKKYKGEFNLDWVAISAQVSGRTKTQCNNRWRSTLDPNIDRANGRTGSWAEDEDINLTDAVRAHGAKNWKKIAALVPGRTKRQCHKRWCDTLSSTNDSVTARAGIWTEDEDIQLKNAVHKHAGKDWAAIAILVSGRTREQCHNRWHRSLDPSIDQTLGRSGKWKEDEDIKLKNAVHKHGGKNWAAIAALVPGRTSSQCSNRWHRVLDPSISPTANRRTGKWNEDEDTKLKNAVHKHGGEEWAAISALVPDRTMNQCRGRWHYALA